jgi:hypothetical protein
MFCNECGSQIPDRAPVCVKCGVPTGIGTRLPAVDIGQNARIRMLLPLGRSGYAIAAGYLGLFSLLIVPAPLALLFGILAVRHIRRDPKKHGMGRAVFGIVMGSLGSVVIAFTLLTWVMHWGI